MSVSREHERFVHKLMTPNVEGWRPWFAWRPVLINGSWHWWEWVEKGTLWGPIGDSGYGMNVYRLSQSK